MDPNNFIRLAQQGNEVAFRTIVEKYRTYVYQQVTKYTSDEEEINKSIKIIFKVMWDNIGYFKLGKENFLGWVREIITHVCVLKKYYLEDNDNEKKEDNIDLADHKAMLKEIRKFFHEPEANKNSTISKINFIDFLTMEEINLLFLKYMYQLSLDDIATSIGKNRNQLERDLISAERRLLIQYRRVRISEKRKTRKDY